MQVFSWVCECVCATHPHTHRAYKNHTKQSSQARAAHSFEISKSRNGVCARRRLGCMLRHNTTLSHIHSCTIYIYTCYICRYIYQRHVRWRYAHAKKCTFPFPAICATACSLCKSAAAVAAALSSLPLRMLPTNQFNLEIAHEHPCAHCAVPCCVRVLRACVCVLICMSGNIVQ